MRSCPSGSVISGRSLIVTVNPNTNASCLEQCCCDNCAAAVTFTAPANAVGFILENESTTANTIRWAAGSVATSTVGNYYEAGRDTGYVPMAKNISVIVQLKRTRICQRSVDFKPVRRL